MPGLMADNDVEGQFQVLIELLTHGTWCGTWDALKFTVESFESLGLERTTPDLVVWQTCQRRGVILFTGNRNQDGPDSLETAIRTLNQPDSLPVITLADANRFLREKPYRERVVDKLMEYLVYLDDYRGAGRLYVP